MNGSASVVSLLERTHAYTHTHARKQVFSTEPSKVHMESLQYKLRMQCRAASEEINRSKFDYRTNT